MTKSKIKDRKTRLKEYDINTSSIPKNDPIERLMYCIGDKLTIKKVNEIIERKNKILKNLTYSCVKLTLYEYPAGSHRPRTRRMGQNISIYVPNAKDNKVYFNKFIQKLKKDIKIIHTPIYIILNIYYQMPNTVSVEESVLFEAGLLHPIVPVDIDNVFKSYTDQMFEKIILDDDLVYKAKIEKFFSFLPRVELFFYYDDKFVSKYIYNKIKKRKTYLRLKDNIVLSKLI